MNTDAADLRQFAATGSEDAFSALVQRYLPLVYAAALRRVDGDVHRAQDIAQLVFTAVARNAAALARHPDLTGWLFTTTRFLAAKARRTERRRQGRERAVSVAAEVMSDDSNRETTAPLDVVLDDVMMELRQIDRQLILLRFHRGLRLAEIGAQLGATENAVQKRLDRALEQLRGKLARRGITSTAAAVALAFEHQAAVAVPATLTAAATTAGLAGGSGASGLFAVSSLMTVSKLQFGFAAAIVAAGSAGLVWQTSENAQLRREVEAQASHETAQLTALRQKLAALTQRATAAKADAASLQKALQAAAAAPRPHTLVDPQEQAHAELNRASHLAAEGKLQEALDLYLKCYRSLAGTRGSMFQQIAMSDLLNLGKKFPPALVALRELRDAALQKFQAEPGSREAITEIALLNERLGESRATIALYESLSPDHPGRQALALIAHDSFVEARRYADALVGKTPGSMTAELEMGTRSSVGLGGQSALNHRSFVVRQTLSNIEVLAGAGKNDEARALTEKLLAYDGSPATRAALARHLDRAAGRSAAP